MHAVSIADCKDSNTIFILPFTMILVVADYYIVLYKMDRKVSMPNIEFSTIVRKIVELDTLNWLAGSQKLYKKIVSHLNDTCIRLWNSFFKIKPVDKNRPKPKANLANW